MATEQPKFMSVSELKEFLRERGIQTSLFSKEQLIKLAVAGVGKPKGPSNNFDPILTLACGLSTLSEMR
jgi:hypothetical protein